jgi:hypothetical protein
MELIESNTPFVVFLPASETIVSVKGNIKSASSSKRKGKTVEETPPSNAIEYDQNKATQIASWGTNNDFPAQMDTEIELNPTLTGAIEKKVRYLYAGGVEFGEEVIVDGKKTWQYLDNPEINMMLNSPQVQQYFAQAIFDYVRYGSVFPEIVFSLDKSKALFCTGQEAFHSRWQKQNPSSGYIDNAYVNRNWALGRDDKSADTLTIPVLDPFVDTVDSIKLESNIFKYIFRSRIPTSKTYYPLVNWWSAKASGWLDVSNYIPRFKKSLMLRQMSAKKHCEIDVKWLEIKYEDKWLKADVKTKNEIFKAEIKHMNEILTGPDKAGGTIMTSKFWDADISQFVSAFTFHDLSDQSTSGAYIEDSNEADSKIHYAIGLDMTMSNTKGGSGMGGGSGSDKREAFNMEQSTNTLDASIILMPIYWMINYNGLNPTGSIRLRMRSPQLQTLDNVSPDNRDTVQKI